MPLSWNPFTLRKQLAHYQKLSSEQALDLMALRKETARLAIDLNHAQQQVETLTRDKQHAEQYCDKLFTAVTGQAPQSPHYLSVLTAGHWIYGFRK